MDKANTNTAGQQIMTEGAGMTLAQLQVAKVTADFAGDWKRAAEINAEIAALRTAPDAAAIEEMEAGAAIRRANRIDPADAIEAQNKRVEATNRTAMGRSMMHGLDDGLDD